MNKLLFYLFETAKKIWFRCLLYCLLALFAIIFGYYIGDYVPDTFADIVTKKGLDDILTIVASSMLAVTTFSLSILVQALNAAANTATPRANRLLMEDNTAQNALGTFIGAFLFSIVALIGTTSTLYNEGSIFILFAFTALMIFLVIVMLLRWIDQLSKLGRVNITINMVEQALIRSIEGRAKSPYLGALRLSVPIDYLKENYYPIHCEKVGYIQYIDFHKINELAEKSGTTIYLTVNPGAFVDSVKKIGFSQTALSEEDQQAIVNAVAIDDERTFSQDPRYGFIVLCEIALRALSPGINDPGTAIDVIGTYIRSAKLWNEKKNQYLKTLHSDEDTIQVKYQHVHMIGIDESDLLEDMYGPMLDEAAKQVSVSIRLKKSLLTLKNLPDSLFAEGAEVWIKRLEARCSGYDHQQNVCDVEGDENKKTRV